MAGFSWLLLVFFSCYLASGCDALLLVSLFAQGFRCLQRNLERKCSWLDCGINPG